MQITFYQFTKRTNSTKQPDVTGTDLTCQLKSNTSMFTPTIDVKDIPVAWAPIWNYCYIPAFGRYYFVNNWTWLNGIWEATCICDVLASHKTTIGNMSEYIARSSYEFDEYIMDTAYLATADVRYNRIALTTHYNAQWNGGFYVIGIINSESTATQGAITYYQMTAAEFAHLRAYLLSDNFLTSQGLVNLADFIPADATKVIYNPFQYIASCKWFPFAAGAISSSYKTSVSQIEFGWWNTGTGFSAYRINANCPLYEITETYTLTSHPQISRGVWLNRSPYTRRFLRYMPFGDITITDDQVKAGSKVRTHVYVDFITGVAILEVSIDNSTQSSSDVCLIAREAQDISVDIQLAQIGKDYYGAQATRVESRMYEFNNLVGAAGGIDLSSIGAAAQSGFNLGSKISMMRDYEQYVATGNYLKAGAPQLLTSGTNGSLACFAPSNYIYEFFYMIEDDNNSHIGRPLSAVRTIKNIPGFIMVKHPDVAMNCFETERSLITQFLQNGFFYE